MIINLNFNQEVTNSLSSNNILEKKTCPIKAVGAPKLSLNSFENQEKKMIGMFLDDKKVEVNEQEDHDESFLDSPDPFIFNLEEEKEKKPSTLFFKRGKTVVLLNKNWKI